VFEKPKNTNSSHCSAQWYHPNYCTMANMVVVHKTPRAETLLVIRFAIHPILLSELREIHGFVKVLECRVPDNGPVNFMLINGADVISQYAVVEWMPLLFVLPSLAMKTWVFITGIKIGMLIFGTITAVGSIVGRARGQKQRRHFEEDTCTKLTLFLLFAEIKRYKKLIITN
jgi:hypothetical protein